MPIPPPPPSLPPPPPPPLGVLQSQTEPPTAQCGDSGRSALLAEIQKGTRLKKVVHVNDRSAPTLTKPRVNTLGGNSGAGINSGGPTASQGPTLSGLFAGGFPALRPVGQRDKGLHSHPVTRSGSAASLKQPLWNLPSQGESFRGSTPDLSPSSRSLERTSSLLKTRPVSSYTAPPSPSQATPPSFKPLSCPPTITPPPIPPHQEHARNKSPPLSTCLPPPPPPQITKPTWLPIQSYSIPMSTMPLPPPHSLIPSVALSDRLSGFFYSEPPSPKPGDARFSPPAPPPPPFSASFTPTPASLPPPPLPPPPKLPAGSMYRPAVPLLPPSYPCTAPTRKPPAVPGAAGAGRLAPPPASPARSPTTELSSRIPPPLPPLPPVPPLCMRNGHLHNFGKDDFESKFHFHPVEEFPPPEVFRPFPRIYPSKENRVSSQAPGVRTHLR
ncbi:WAS/WASL-interacting protein family member 3 isoform X2 [Silurus meridionalis]|uniref:WH2 domain-containing protein n=2 Tax=Silurus meridionalis TaxID=175797 RepID=A0A8T0AGC4_SILME|nr:WAS/WASL-interacting protein family member 3 isoform X2 [Silurus meridionalis]KAF7691428.1 hypothetical protein HF521_011725 [Silurus meridionalis]